MRDQEKKSSRVQEQNAYQEEEDELPDDANDINPEKDPDFEHDEEDAPKVQKKRREEESEDSNDEELEIGYKKQKEYERKANEYIQKLDKKRKAGTIDSAILLVSVTAFN